jgi:hypothetical protein
MSWGCGLPQDQWKEREISSFLREIHTRWKCDTFTWDPPNVPANSVVSTTLTTVDASTVKGLRAGMPIQVTPPSDIADGLSVTAWVATDNTLTIRLRNHTGGAIDQASGTWGFIGGLP